MRSLMTLLILYLFSLLSIQVLCSQTLIYDAFLHGHQVGELVVQKEVSDNKTSITSKTHIEAHLLTIDIETTSVYIDEALTESETIQKQNDKIHSSVIIHQTGNGYKVNIDGHEKALLKKELLGADLLYFEEPKQIEQILSLATGELLTIQKDEQGRYFFLHDGKKELHQYKAGALDNAEINHQLYTIQLRRRN